MIASTSERRTARQKVALAAILALVAAAAASDLLIDLRAGTTWLHVLFEAATFCAALAGAAWFGAQAARARRSLEQAATTLRASLSASREDAERWRKGLSEAIDRQLTEWGLSPAEKEIARLLLKGLSHKEIAEVRSVEESSVRQQARSIYRKAQLQGRSELAAFFLEDLLVPSGDRP